MPKLSLGLRINQIQLYMALLKYEWQKLILQKCKYFYKYSSLWVVNTIINNLFRESPVAQW